MDLKKTWNSLLIIALVLFIIIGIVKIVVDRAYLEGGQYLITAIIYGYVVQMIRKKRYSQDLPNSRMKLGFILSVLGLRGLLGNVYVIGLWGLGLILLLSGIFNKQKEDVDTSVEDK